MLMLALLLQAAAPPPTTPAGPGQPPATMVVEPAAMMIAACDRDGDGRTSLDELTQCVKKSYEAIDTQKTGKIVYIAFADWAERWLGDRNALPSPFETDADGDNRITLSEIETKMAQIFTRLDRDHDGYVTRAECLTIRASFPRDPGKGKRKRGDAPGDGR